MKKYIIHGGKKLSGEVAPSGSKNVVLKAVVAACLTDEEVELHNIPHISDFFVLLELVREIGGEVHLYDHSLKIRFKTIKNTQIPLEIGAKIRTSSMFLAPLLARCGEALIPNPGGCRIGARPIDRHIEGLEKMGASIKYYSRDGYFHAKTEGLSGTTYTFEKNTHTGTETLMLAAVLARGQTILHNAAEEPEIDNLIELLSKMGAKIRREKARTIIIDGVTKLNGASFTIMPDRNEVMTFAVASALTGGKIWIKNCDLTTLTAFLEKFKEAGGAWEQKNSSVRFFLSDTLKPVDITTNPHPGFMTDWQGPWAVLMTQADGKSIIHETIYENRFTYVDELLKMGADLELYNPRIDSPKEVYNFNYDKRKQSFYKQALRIYGPTKLHNAVLNILDLRAGATLVLASLIAKGESVVYGVEFLERGYEAFDKRLRSLGADIHVSEESTLQ